MGECSFRSLRAYALKKHGGCKLSKCERLGGGGQVFLSALALLFLSLSLCLLAPLASRFQRQSSPILFLDAWSKLLLASAHSLYLRLEQVLGHGGKQHGSDRLYISLPSATALLNQNSAVTSHLLASVLSVS